jgi:hypothetical protein
MDDLPLLHPVWWVLPLLHQQISFFIHSITFLHPEDGLRAIRGVSPWEQGVPEITPLGSRLEED